MNKNNNKIKLHINYYTWIVRLFVLFLIFGMVHKIEIGYKRFKLDKKYRKYAIFVNHYELAKVVKYGYQLTLKDMTIIGRKKDDKYVKLLMDIRSKYDGISGVMLLPTADYNIHYFPDSSIRDKFISKKRIYKG